MPFGRPGDPLGATLVVYGGADGYVQGASTTYLTARSTATGATAGALVVGQDFSTPNYTCFEGFVQFASGFGADDHLISHTLSLMPSSIASLATDFIFTVGNKDYGAAVDTGDWIAGASLPESHGTIDTAALVVDQYCDIPLTGTSYKFVLYSDRHKAGTAPTGAEFVEFYSAATAGTTKDPKLTIDYYSSSYAGGAFTGSLGRVTAWPRALTADEAQQAFGSGMVVYDRSRGKGTVGIEGHVRNRKGALIPATHVRADGTWWVQHLEQGSGDPILITGHAVNDEAGTNALTLGVDWMEEEIGVRYADLLAWPATVAPTPTEAAALDPTMPEEVVDPADTEPADAEPVSTYQDTVTIDTDPASPTYGQVIGASFQGQDPGAAAGTTTTSYNVSWKKK